MVALLGLLLSFSSILNDFELPDPDVFEGNKRYVIKQEWNGIPQHTWVLVPKTHLDRPLATVIVSPTGLPLYYGRDIDMHYKSEFSPYLQAGYAVIVYSVHGHASQEDPWQDRVQASEEFTAGDCGLVNGRFAFLVALRIPEVDASQIFVGGCSSGAVLALQLAAVEPRLKGCIALSPKIDMENFYDSGLLRLIAEKAPDFPSKLKQMSPQNLTDRYHNYLFVFGTRNDLKCPPQELVKFVGKLTFAKEVRLVLEREGGHDACIRTGITQALSWLSKICRE